tara:strand:- start:2462 stop:3328 length:867 start_codon:yes stop_codon:yes gene_type:complete
MAINSHFRSNVKAEQNLYEDLTIEAIQMYGQDVYYLPREVQNKDKIFLDDIPSRFSDAYQVEMYIENQDGFEGEGDIFTKFGIELRDQATFVVARKRWTKLIGENLSKNNFRPREGDLIFLPMSESLFQINKVETETPFYQLQNLPTFRMTCELFEYNDEDFDTGIDEIQEIEEDFTYKYQLILDSGNGGFTIGETVSQVFDTYTMKGEVTHWSDSDNRLELAHAGATDGKFHTFTTTKLVSGADASGTPTLVKELQDIQDDFQNKIFDDFEGDFLDFSEANPFGDIQ